MATLTLIQIGMRFDLAAADLEARKSMLQAAVASDKISMKGILDLAKKASRSESECDKARDAYHKALLLNQKRVSRELEKVQKRYDAAAKKEERERVKARVKAEKEAKREADRRANKRAKALDRFYSLHQSALNGKNTTEKLLADRISDLQIEAALDACAECKDSGRIAFARVMFAVAYSRQREVFTKIGILEAEGLIAVAAKYERILVKASVNTLTLREELNRAA